MCRGIIDDSPEIDTQFGGGQFNSDLTGCSGVRAVPSSPQLRRRSERGPLSFAHIFGDCFMPWSVADARHGEAIGKYFKCVFLTCDHEMTQT